MKQRVESLEQGLLKNYTRDELITFTNILIKLILRREDYTFKTDRNQPPKIHPELNVIDPIVDLSHEEIKKFERLSEAITGEQLKVEEYNPIFGRR
jgi:hypothetical protein